MKKYIKMVILIVISLIILMGISSYYAIVDFNYNAAGYGGITLFEIITEQINSQNMMLFNLSFVLLFFLLDVNNISFSKNVLINVVINVVVFISIFMLANFIFLSYRFGVASTLSNTWSKTSEFTFTQRSPIFCCFISLLLFGLRLTCMVYLVYLINFITKKDYWGFWIILFVSHIDFTFYNFTRIKYPIYILPIEHTRIIYTAARAIPGQYVERFSYFISVSYWLIIITVIDIIFSIYNRKDKVELN